MTGDQATPSVQLAGRWWTWRDMAVRSAGFAIDDLLTLGQPELAAAVDASTGDSPTDGDAYRAALDRSLAALASIVDGERFRQALLWQNRDVVPYAVDWYLAELRRGGPRNHRRRFIEERLTRYVQRYHAKNESVGFFGPVGWAHWADGGPLISVDGYQGEIAQRRTQFERWCIQAVADRLSADPEARRWLVPSLAPTIAMIDGQVRTPVWGRLPLPRPEVDVISSCDGTRTVADIARHLLARGVPGIESCDDVERVLSALERRGYLALGVLVPPTADAERFLRRRVEGIADPAARHRWAATLDRLEASRDAVHDATGHRSLAASLAAADAEFTALTGAAASRLTGESFMGRSLLVEDCRSALDVHLHPALREHLAAPLELVLESARWLVSRIADRYLEILGEIHTRMAEPGERTVPLAAICYEFWPRCAQERVNTEAADIVAELRHRWSEILRVPAASRRHRVAAADIATAVRTAFAAPSVPWLSGRFHSPDLMIAAADAASIADGDCEWVLGELHSGLNTLNQGTFMRQHPLPDRVAAMADEDAGGGQWLIPIYPSTWPYVTGRSYPPPYLASSRHSYYRFATEPPRDAVTQPVVPISELTMVRGEDGTLRVDDASGRRYHPLAALGEFLSISGLGDAFRPFAPAPRRPRVAIDRLVVSREQWRVELATLAWPHERGEVDRYRAARRWVRSLELPRFVFVRTTDDGKPFYVDLTSPPLVNMIASTLRRAAKADDSGSVVITEMYPDPTRLWLPHSRPDRRCTSELRVAVVERCEDPDDVRTGVTNDQLFAHQA